MDTQGTERTGAQGFHVKNDAGDSLRARLAAEGLDYAVDAVAEEIKKRFPTNKILRWIRCGRLEAVKIGGVWMTSRAAVARMVDRDTAAAHQRATRVQSTRREEARTQRQQQKERAAAVAAAESLLAASGLAPADCE